MKPLNEWTAVEAAAAIAAGKTTSEALVAACLERIAAREGEVNAWTHLDRAQALAAAKRRDIEPPRGPLHGVPIGVKDIIDTAEMPTGYGSPIYAGNRPAWNAACVALAERAGAVILGKTVTTEFAYFGPGKTCNPHDTAHTPGGSSSGSAAAVADMMVPIAFGSQTAASITRPAAFCGVVGYKPSFDTLPLAGIKPFAPSLDTLGTMTRSVGDAALMRAALLGLPATPLASWAGAPRIGLCRTPWWAQAEPAAVAAVEGAARRLAEGGATIGEAPLADDLDGLVEMQKTIMAYEANRSYAWEFDAHAGKLTEPLRALIEAGRAVPRGAYLAALAAASHARRRVGRMFGRWDALLAPSARGEAPRGLGATGDPIFSRAWTLLHLPSVALPCGKGPQGLPVGVQLIGPLGADEALLRIAAWAEERLG